MTLGPRDYEEYIGDIAAAEDEDTDTGVTDAPCGPSRLWRVAGWYSKDDLH